MKNSNPQAVKPTIYFNTKLFESKALKKVEASVYLKFPKSAKLPSLSTIAIEGTLNGYPFNAVLEINAKGSHCLNIDKALQDAVGANVGDSVTVEIMRVGEEHETRIPLELRKALTATPLAKALWNDITPLARRDWVLWIVTAKLLEARQSRIEKTYSMLASGKRRVCCFGGMNWLKKSAGKRKAK